MTVRTVDSDPESHLAGTESSIDPPTTDTGYGWIIVAAAFLIFFISDGVAFSFGIMYPGLTNRFQVDEHKISWIGSFFFAMPFLMSPITALVVNQFGCRFVIPLSCVLGGLLTAGGVLLSVWAESLEILILTFGLVTGFGLSLSLIGSLTSVTMQFDRLRALTIGIVLSATPIGTFALAPLMEWLSIQFEWTGCLLALSVFLLNISIFGLLMHDPIMNNGTIRQKDNDQFKKHKTMVIPLKGGIYGKFTSNKKYKSGNGRAENSKSNQNELRMDRMSIANLSTCASFSEFYPSICYDDELNRKSTDRMVVPYENQNVSNSIDIVQKWSQFKYPEFKYPSTEIERKFAPPGAIPLSSIPTKMEYPNPKELTAFFGHSSASLSMAFCLFCLNNLILYIFVDIPVVKLPEYSLSHLEISDQDSKFLVSIIGMFSIPGLILMGVLSDLTRCNLGAVYGVCCCVCGLCITVMPFIRSYTCLVCVCAVFGISISANITLSPVIVYNLLTINSFAKGFGLINLAKGLGLLLAPAVDEYIRSFTGEMMSTFMIGGLGISLSGLLMFFADIYAAQI